MLANRYFLTSEIGPGAVATMWNAYDRIKDEQVAIKILHGAAASNPQRSSSASGAAPSR